MTLSPAIDLDASQQAAVDLACSARICVITGGPGTGKTTCLRQALDRVDTTGEAGSYALASPTGKAARRLTETTGREATTVHRLLSYGPLPTGGLGFRFNADNRLPHRLVVVDESSMIDIELARALFAAIDTDRTRLVLVGDANQLPSVGPGRVFADLIESGRVPVARLTTLHRAAAQSWVCSQAPRILAGELPDLETRNDFAWSRCERSDEAATEAFRQASNAAGAPQLLIPMRVGTCGTAALNMRLQPRLNAVREGEPEGWKVGDYVLREGDRVIQTRNDYKLGVFNGEVGVIERIHAAARECEQCAGSGRVGDASFAGSKCCECGGSGKVPQQLVVRYPDVGKDRRVGYSRIQADGLQLAYALTVHKSQGSEWPWVVVVCHSAHSHLLTRGLLYTAITRAKVGVVLVGDDAGLQRAVKDTRDQARNTALAERLRSAASAKAAA
jgi:exodeoxyribonuclease V alpha subunit